MGCRVSRREGTLSVDMTACKGRGLCVELLAGRLGRDEWGYPWAVDEAGRSSTRLTLRGGEELGAAREAVALCPMRALHLR